MKASSRTFFITLLLCIFAAYGNVNGEISSSTTPIFTRNLTIGIRGNDVSALQQFLIAGGFLKAPTSTGYFGALTKVALAAWQKSVSISPSAGFFGSVSREKISSNFQQLLANANTSQAQNISTVAATTTATTNVATSSNSTGLPIRLKIPSLNIDAGFQYTGFKSDGTMDIPSNIFDVGWFTGSPRPGEKGNSIITGHVAQIRGGVMTKPGVFSDLIALRPGDKLYVTDDKGKSVTFVVRESRAYDPTADATDVFTSKDNGVHLNLITCEGSWNSAKLSYSQRLVVFTDLGN